MPSASYTENSLSPLLVIVWGISRCLVEDKQTDLQDLQMKGVQYNQAVGRCACRQQSRVFLDTEAPISMPNIKLLFGFFCLCMQATVFNDPSGSACSCGS